MKKLFTLVAMAIMAVGANAQGTFIVGANTAVTGDVTSVSNITMTWGSFKTPAQLSDGVPSVFKTAGYTTMEYKATGSENVPKAEYLAPTKGSFVKFVPTVAGTLTVAYKLNKNKTQAFIEDGVKVNSVAETTGSSQYLLTPITVKANSTYFVYTEGSNMDFFGFIFDTTSGITSISAEAANADAPAYNIAGQRVNKNAKGLVICNGKKYVNK